MCFVYFVHFSAASRALIDHPDMTAEEVARKAMNIAADMCVHTNHNFLVETLACKPTEEEEASPAEKKKSKTKKGGD